jgi:hypothetical protein
VTANRFDRLRPRAVPPEPPSVVAHDAEGKRALFSSTHGDDRPGAGSVIVECSRCDQRTVLAPFAALRAAVPSLHFGLGVGRGENESTVGLLRRRHASVMRCPACGRVSWVRVTIRL